MIVLCGPKKNNENQRNNASQNKGKKTRGRKLNLPIDVIDGIQQDGGGMSWIHDNAINIDVPPPSRQLMVTLPHVEHLAR